MSGSEFVGDVSVIEVEAVHRINFEVKRDELFGLLGPSGAGKTTAIKMLITLLLPSGGSTKVLGFDLMFSRARVLSPVLRSCAKEDQVIDIELPPFGVQFPLSNTE